MLEFLAKPFAIAGAVAAAGPILIHLLNRRRFRTVNWAAMDFLRQALQRNRRVLHLRDLLLLMLRCTCVLLIGMAVARPFLKTAGGAAWFQSTWPWGLAVVSLGCGITAVLSATKAARWLTSFLCLAAAGLAGQGIYDSFRQANSADIASQSAKHPVHAVLVVDNSLSMAFKTLEGTLLNQAKARAVDFIDRLPPESRVTVIPLCADSGSFSLDAFRNKDDARNALSRLQIVDRAGSVPLGLQLAEEACNKTPDLPAKRVVLLSDQQVANWPAGRIEELERLPELQVVAVAGDASRNVGVTRFNLQDGIADVETTSTFVADVRNFGPDKVQDAQVTLSVGGVAVFSRMLDLEPGQTRRVEFSYQIDVPPAEPGRPRFVPSMVTVATADPDENRLDRDDTRHLVVPVVTGVPVVFVDELGAGKEDVLAGVVGESKLLRRYLAPRLSRDPGHRQLIRVRHVTIDELSRDLLQDARLVVIAGVKSPAGQVELLREYVAQGGSLFITAGAEFNPREWSRHGYEDASQDGGSLLPLPLAAESIGRTPPELELSGELDQLQPFHLDYQTMQHQYFVIESEADDELAAYYRGILFFKAARMLDDERTLAEFREREVARLTKAQSQADETNAKLAELEGQTTETPEQAAERKRLLAERRQRELNWLLWKRDETELRERFTPEQIAERNLPRVLARFDMPSEQANEASAPPAVVQRQLGRGRVIFFASGVNSAWNSIPMQGNSLGLFDRMLRSLIEETLPRRTYDTDERITLPAEPDRRIQYALDSPDGESSILTASATGGDQYGIVLDDISRAGEYRLTTSRVDPDGNAIEKQETVFAVNGPPGESDLAAVTPELLTERLGEASEQSAWRWIAKGESISLEGAAIRGRGLWKMLVLAVLVGLLLEMAILSRTSRAPSVSAEPAPQ